MPTNLAYAKVNLTLQVGPAIKDVKNPKYGYHPLSSLVVFADYGDEVKITEAAQARLEIDGPFAKKVPHDADNLILRTLDFVKSELAKSKIILPNFHIYLRKNLPVAAGLGGGSADAAALLRLIRPFTQLSADKWAEICVPLSLSLGADIPVCLLSQTCLMEGIGEQITPISGLGEVPALLVNPGIAISTGAIFMAYAQTPHLPLRAAQIDSDDLISLCMSGSNDLQNIAVSMAPALDEVLTVLGMQSGCHAARLSGSGASCFALFDDVDLQSRALQKISKAYPSWWIQSVKLGQNKAIENKGIKEQKA